MQDPTASRDLETDDVCFAQTACIKLVKLLQGTLSVGLPSLVTGFPDSRLFFDEAFHVMEAYATVLQTIGGKASATELILHLRRCSGELHNEIRRLRGELMAATPGAGGQTNHSFRAARDATERICDLIGEYTHMLGRDLALFAEIKALSLRLFDCIPEMCPASPP